MPPTPHSPPGLLRDLFDTAVAAAHPRRCLPAHLPAPPERGRLLVLAAGKAAGSMAEVAEAHYLDTLGLAAGRLHGLAVARHGYGRPTRAVRMVEAGHPVPDKAGLTATADTLRLAQAAGADDLVLVLLSGGASANWIAPAAGLTLGDKQAVTRALLASGAQIGEINAVRKHLSRIKGGRLARAARPARLVTLAISDVPGDDPAVIGSGPTVADATTLADARAVLAKYNIAAPEAVHRVLDDPASESVKADDPVLQGTIFSLIARPTDALAAAAAKAREAGYEPILLGDRLEGEARDVAADHARQARELAQAGRRAVLISGGELTVTLRGGGTGSGRGGPNQEYALALAMALDGLPGVHALAGDTDGTDGGGGNADDPAGAWCGPDTLARARALGLDPAAALTANDSTGFFETLGDLLRTGPTHTNVNDFRAILIDRP